MAYPFYYNLIYSLDNLPLISFIAYVFVSLIWKRHLFLSPRKATLHNRKPIQVFYLTICILTAFKSHLHIPMLTSNRNFCNGFLFTIERRFSFKLVSDERKHAIKGKFGEKHFKSKELEGIYLLFYGTKGYRDHHTA